MGMGQPEVQAGEQRLSRNFLDKCMGDASAHDGHQEKSFLLLLFLEKSEALTKKKKKKKKKEKRKKERKRNGRRHIQRGPGCPKSGPRKRQKKKKKKKIKGLPSRVLSRPWWQCPEIAQLPLELIKGPCWEEGSEGARGAFVPAQSQDRT